MTATDPDRYGLDDEFDDNFDAEAFERGLEEIDFDRPEDFDPAANEVLRRLFAMLPPGKVLPPDLEALFEDVRNHAILRMIIPTKPPVAFEGFEAFDATHGGMGVVLKARDPELDRFVAIKLWIQSGPAAQQALLAEARTLAKFTHPNVVTIHAAGTWQDRAYFVMEWVDGMDGSAWMRCEPSWLAIREVFACIGDGLAAAHDAGIQHRDFKPANMLIGSEGRALVADFGVADTLDAPSGELDRNGSIVGTPAYMAPERLRGEQGDAHSDQFSFCVTLWRALYGTRPFEGRTPAELLASISRGVPWEGGRSGVPRRLRDIALRGLAIDPVDRHRDMHALVDALLAAPIDGVDEVEEPSSRDAKTLEADDRVHHTPRWGTFGGVTGLVFMSLMLGFGYGRSHETLIPMLPSMELVLPQTEAAVPAEQPCLTEVPADLDDVMVQVCRLIRLDEFRAANMLWEIERGNRKLSSTRVDRLSEDSLTIARTFSDQAGWESSDQIKAESAATYARRWALVAAGEVVAGDLRAREIEAEADRIITMGEP